MSRKQNTAVQTNNENLSLADGAAMVETAGSQVGATETNVVTKKAIESIDLSACGDNKSAKVRALSAEGFSRGEIAKFIGIKYQFVRNVLVQAAGKAAA